MITAHALGALLENEHRAAVAIAELVRLGVPADQLLVGMDDEANARRFAQAHGAVALPGASVNPNLFETMVMQRPEGSPRRFASALEEAGVDPERIAVLAPSLHGERVLVVVPPAYALDPRIVEILATLRADLGLANANGVDEIIPLREERITVGKRVVATGDVTIRTEIISEMHSVDVPLEREEAVIERRYLLEDGSVGRVETIRVPLRHEEVEVVKRTVVTDEVHLRTEQRVDVERVETVSRKEVLRTNAAGDITGERGTPVVPEPQT